MIKSRTPNKSHIPILSGTASSNPFHVLLMLGIYEVVKVFITRLAIVATVAWVPVHMAFRTPKTPNVACLAHLSNTLEKQRLQIGLNPIGNTANDFRFHWVAGVLHTGLVHPESSDCGICRASQSDPLSPIMQLSYRSRSHCSSRVVTSGKY